MKVQVYTSSEPPQEHNQGQMSLPNEGLECVGIITVCDKKINGMKIIQTKIPSNKRPDN